MKVILIKQNSIVPFFKKHTSEAPESTSLHVSEDSIAHRLTSLSDFLVDKGAMIGYNLLTEGDRVRFDLEDRGRNTDTPIPVSKIYKVESYDDINFILVRGNEGDLYNYSAIKNPNIDELPI